MSHKNILPSSKLKRIIAVVLLLCVASVFLLMTSHTFQHVCDEHGHGVIGAECSVCIHIGNAVKVISKFVLAIFTALFAVAALTAAHSPMNRVLHGGSSTPVSLKLRMNN